MTKRMKSIVTRSKIRGVIKESPWSTAHDIHRETGLSKAVVRRHLAEMLEAGDLKREKRSLRRNVSAWAYAMANYQARPKWSIMLDREHYNPKAVQLFLTVQGDSGPEVAMEYGREHKDLPIMDWRLLILTTERLEVLHDGDEHQIHYFDPDIRCWISGPVFLMSDDIHEANLRADGDEVVLIYKLNGLGNPNQPKMEWMNA
jgi:DNA-binding Lrp family transcriptional regulator